MKEYTTTKHTHFYHTIYACNSNELNSIFNLDLHCLKEISFYAVIGAFITTVTLITMCAMYKCTFTQRQGMYVWM